jgi:hypothetical protein
MEGINFLHYVEDFNKELQRLVDEFYRSCDTREI